MSLAPNINSVFEEVEDLIIEIDLESDNDIDLILDATEYRWCWACVRTS